MQIVRGAGGEHYCDQEAGEDANLERDLTSAFFADSDFVPVVCAVAFRHPARCEVVFLNIRRVPLEAEQQERSWMNMNAEPSVGEHQGKNEEKHLVDKAEDPTLKEELLRLPTYHGGNESRNERGL